MASEYSENNTPGSFHFNNIIKLNKMNEKKSNNRTKKRNNNGQPGIYSNTNDPGSTLFPMSAVSNFSFVPGAKLYAPSSILSSSSAQGDEKEPGMNAVSVASASRHPFYGMSNDEIRKKFKESLYKNKRHTLAKSYWNRLKEPSRNHYNDLLDQEEKEYLLDMFALYGVDPSKRSHIEQLIAQYPHIEPVIRAQQYRYTHPKRGGAKRTRRSKSTRRSK